ncbi:S9 family peptidase [Niabella drilacis]|uniref:Dipeptidyl aminopeptidase/acylaminoacyl peptidase n=1 Tax=Niabella drilacis (strain DSM 25811 / CCM 8410 / CCUG 62505 / LMG 26954 / E90) TaxID=1285928 RepID=A0A1G6UN78_NIADE|nr:S9 family peptidase [Niabella drilacis]SDD42749.1 Dipeptidyl aminopeptidase/acylaminoacyl peptidase [Niabella drilacis]
MTRYSIFAVFIAATALLFSCKHDAKEKPAPLIDMKTFFRNGEKSTFRISPDGHYFSYRADYKGKTNIFVQKVSDSTAIRVTNDTLRSIGGYFWKGDRIVYAQDIGGDENFQLFSVKTDGTDLKALTPFPGVRSDIIDALLDISGKEKELIVQINKRVKEYFDPYLLNIETGALTLLYDNKENYDSWVTDNNGVIRLASKTDGVNITWNYRNSDKDPFTPLLTTSFKDLFTPASFDRDNKILYALSNIGRDKVVLVEYDPVTKKDIKELYADNNYDLGSIKYDRKKQSLTSVYWVAEKQKQHFFDAEWGAIQSGLDKKFEGYETEIVSYDDARSKAIVAISNDRAPVKYYIYDFGTRAINEVANPYPWIEEKQMSFVKPITYQSRDGLVIHGYLTLPLGLDPKGLPVVINPHGGPWARDGWYYNPETQFLANRGYAVLQMNYRGSTGYGKKFWEASFKQWGKQMQDDITDGVEWLKKQGIADPKRIAIYGGSYGGYATLAGITFTPDLYAAAVDYVGVSNLFTFLNTIPPYWKPYLDQFHEMVGDPKKDSVLLASASPVLHVDKIRAPLFIAQGANDPRVNKAESDQMVAALKKRGIEVEYMVKADEGHGFHNQDNQYDFYGAMEQFLNKHLKPKK